MNYESSGENKNLKIIPITAKETHAVRHPVLRPGKSIATCVFNNDDDINTIHFGGFIGTHLVAVVTFLKNEHKAHNIDNAYQLRGMAVLQEYQGCGFGKILVTFGERHFLKQNIDFIWMNAREKAVSFYNKINYTIIGNIFEIPSVGNHYVMFKKLK